MELLKAGQKVRVVGASAWPHLVGVVTTIREVRKNSIFGGPGYLLDLYHKGDPFIVRPEEIEPVDERQSGNPAIT